VKGCGGQGGPGGPRYYDPLGLRGTGPPGPPGARGPPGATASSGADGDKGHATFSVLDGKSTVNYTSRYDLSLQGAELSSEKGDGIFEPGSMVFVTSVTVKNIGEMPTPATHRVLVYIKPTSVIEDWVVLEGYGRFIRLPLLIQCGEVVRRPRGVRMRGWPSASRLWAVTVLSTDGNSPESAAARFAPLLLSS
jgi:hypothetical protein